MKKIIVVIAAVFLFTVPIVRAEKYRILYMNTQNIIIGGKTLVVGDEFDDADIISWASDRQAIRVVSKTSSRQMTLTSKLISGRKSLSAYIKTERNLATRPGCPMSIPDIRQAIPHEVLLLDRFEVHTAIPVDQTRFFYASYVRNNEEINKKLPSLYNGGFCIDRSLWEIDGVPFKTDTLKVSIFYYDMSANKVTTIVENVLIIPLETNVQ